MHKSLNSPIDFFIDPPRGSILGINYSGMHDSAVAVVTAEGVPVFAISLERLSRCKQDGRPLHELLDSINWDRIDKVAISTPEFLPKYSFEKSILLSTSLPERRPLNTLAHGPGFYEALSKIPHEKIFVGHQDAHASSAFWGSGFEAALCLTYDGGMCNDLWFGGLYKCSKAAGIQPLDQFDALQYAKVSTLYTFVTALLGFMPVRHEGKITGLAAYGKPTNRCTKLLKKWFEQDYFELERTLYWINSYDEESEPQLVASNSRLHQFRAQTEGIGKEELAATIQDFSEKHILQILANARKIGWDSPNICLAGGLFANVKINQKVVESGFDQLFVAPPMTDEGTALGAAWHVASRSARFTPPFLRSMFLGPVYAEEAVRASIKKEGIVSTVPVDPASTIAGLLAQGSVVAVFQGAVEFGPRALGNRSILAQATETDINKSLNERLNRTEFMPFAPMTREEDAEICYVGIDRVRHAAEFMTVTVNCTEIMKQTCPAVVHIDGTARPQLISAANHPLIHAVLSEYKDLTGNLAIVNTSFNVHEEPIICTPEDALRGFFESGLDYLYFQGVGLISFTENRTVAIRYLQDKLKRNSQKSRSYASIAEFLDSALAERTDCLEQTSTDLQERTHELVQTRQTLTDRTVRLEQAGAELLERTEELVATRKALAERTALLEQSNAELLGRTEDLVQTRQGLVERSELLEQTSADLLARTQDLVAARPALAERTAMLEQSNADLLGRTEDLVQTRQGLAERSELLEQASVDLLARTRDLVAAREALAERTAMLEQSNAELLERTEDLVQTRQDLAERSELLELTSADLLARTQDLVAARPALAERTAMLEQSNADLLGRTEDLVQTRQGLAERSELLEQASVDLLTRTQDLVAARQALAERTAMLEQSNAELLGQTKDLVQTRQHLAERSELIEQTSADLLARTQDLVAARQALAERTAMLEQSNAELLERTEDLVQTRQGLAERSELLEQTSADLLARTQDLVAARQALAERTAMLEQSNTELVGQTQDLMKTRKALIERTEQLDHASQIQIKINQALEENKRILMTRNSMLESMNVELMQTTDKLNILSGVHETARKSPIRFAIKMLYKKPEFKQ